MTTKSLLLASLFSTILLSANVDLSDLSGSWHMRVLDGMEVRKARAILDFDAKKMRVDGFDSCNRISGILKENPQTKQLSTQLRTTRMACRGNVQKWVSKRLHETMNEGFSIKEEKKYGVEGITLKSLSHELFFKKMER
ncbi:MAG: META domain-containing protein [Epsilonproteobacteria bacterium]|nr:META domain-containing protein [Campylobacterota bacterium]